MVSDVEFDIPCTMRWLKLKALDNSGNKNSEMTDSVEITKSVSISSTDFNHRVSELSKENAEKAHVDTSVKGAYACVEASVSAGYENSSVMKELLASTKDTTYKQDIKTTSSEKRSFKIGAGDQLNFYQRVFEGPGISCRLEMTQVSSNPNLESEYEKVMMHVRARPQRFIKSMDVAWGEREVDRPENYVHELEEGSADTNCGHKGHYVWMVPEWTYNRDEAATSFDIQIGAESPNMKDLAKGAGGAFRYVHTAHDGYNPERVVDARLIRTGPPLIGGSRDINQGRGGDFLYLAYKVF
ncbi:hypothetical protein B0H66DRAFT_622840 [Apodospora peruviana]|uniref:Uncharacterized protein n=1 Tax=Apodospora peruviana TaxID=516989 RepID=A0AAE0M467_9PEZI|nr:hypothetical protein B0H66DRAFT_622840 [Apodospora peruviana]